jgi:hypothetical protein
MTALLISNDTLDRRHAALRALDETVRSALLAAARRWGLGEDVAIDLTTYDRIYDRRPQLGGHWTLFCAGLTAAAHEVATVAVMVEFDGAEPVDLRVSGVADVVAGGCTRAALAEALVECGGPLRQVTPLPITWPARVARELLAASRN